MKLILVLLGMYFDAVVVFVTNQTLSFRLALAILWAGLLQPWGPPVFLRSFNPRYAHHIATCPPGFSDLSTAPLVCKPRFLLSIIFNKLLWTEPFLWEKNRLNSGLWTTPLQLVILNRKSTQRCSISWE